nr:hypothetical protein [Bacillus toyonensis]
MDTIYDQIEDVFEEYTAEREQFDQGLRVQNVKLWSISQRKK